MSRRTRLGFAFAAVAGLLGWQGWRMLGGWDAELGLPVRSFAASPEAQRPEAAKTLVVFLTSDSGWQSLNTSLPKSIAAAGYPTVAWNSLRYYLQERTPQEASRELERLLDHYSRTLGTERWAIAGYSFGAGVLPFLVNRLPQERRDTLSAVAYLAYPGIASFKFHPSGWLLHLSDEDRSSTAEVEQVPRVPSLCVAGESDPVRDCRSIEGFGVERRLLPLGHGLHAATDEIAAMVLETLARGAREASAPSD